MGAARLGGAEGGRHVVAAAARLGEDDDVLVAAELAQAQFAGEGVEQVDGGKIEHGSSKDVRGNVRDMGSLGSPWSASCGAGGGLRKASAGMREEPAEHALIML